MGLTVLCAAAACLWILVAETAPAASQPAADFFNLFGGANGDPNPLSGIFGGGNAGGAAIPGVNELLGSLGNIKVKEIVNLAQQLLANREAGASGVANVFGGTGGDFLSVLMRNLQQPNGGFGATTGGGNGNFFGSGSSLGGSPSSVFGSTGNAGVGSASLAGPTPNIFGGNGGGDLSNILKVFGIGNGADKAGGVTNIFTPNTAASTNPTNPAGSNPIIPDFSKILDLFAGGNSPKSPGGSGNIFGLGSNVAKSPSGNIGEFSKLLELFGGGQSSSTPTGPANIVDVSRNVPGTAGANRGDLSSILGLFGSGNSAPPSEIPANIFGLGGKGGGSTNGNENDLSNLIQLFSGGNSQHVARVPSESTGNILGLGNNLASKGPATELTNLFSGKGVDITKLIGDFDANNAVTKSFGFGNGAASKSNNIFEQSSDLLSFLGGTNGKPDGAPSSTARSRGFGDILSKILGNDGSRPAVSGSEDNSPFSNILLPRHRSRRSRSRYTERKSNLRRANQYNVDKLLGLLGNGGTGDSELGRVPNVFGNSGFGNIFGLADSNGEASELTSLLRSFADQGAGGRPKLSLSRSST